MHMKYIKMKNIKQYRQKSVIVKDRTKYYKDR